MDACRGADLVTTDVWTSMGFEAENDRRVRVLAFSKIITSVRSKSGW